MKPAYKTFNLLYPSPYNSASGIRRLLTGFLDLYTHMRPNYTELRRSTIVDISYSPPYAVAEGGSGLTSNTPLKRSLTTCSWFSLPFCLISLIFASASLFASSSAFLFPCECYKRTFGLAKAILFPAFSFVRDDEGRYWYSLRSPL